MRPIGETCASKQASVDDSDRSRRAMPEPIAGRATLSPRLRLTRRRVSGSVLRLLPRGSGASAGGSGDRVVGETLLDASSSLDALAVAADMPSSSMPRRLSVRLSCGIASRVSVHVELRHTTIDGRSRAPRRSGELFAQHVVKSRNGLRSGSGSTVIKCTSTRVRRCASRNAGLGQRLRRRLR